MPTAIEINNLSKLYRLGVVGSKTLKDDLQRWWWRMRGKGDPLLKVGEENKLDSRSGDNYVWALRDINLEVRQGEVLGIIGKNGAGKSTLLKILSRITSPTTGEIKIRGRLGSLLEVGTGFHPELTGRENIYLNGAILGMKRSEIDRKFDDIVDFAGVAKYIDTPVKRYSSGMYVRLGFAVAAFLEPDILVVDEVLAVGDAEFQKRAIGKMQEVSHGEGRTVLFVSHNMASIQALCDRTIILKEGHLIFQGKTSQAIEQYLSLQQNHHKQKLAERKDRLGNGLIKFTEVVVKNNGSEAIPLQSGCLAQFIIRFQIKSQAQNVIFRLIIVDTKHQIRCVCNNYHSSQPFPRINNDGEAILEINDFPLPAGTYYIHLQALVNFEVADEIEYAAKFVVEEGDFFGTGKIPNFTDGVFVKHKWYLND